MRAAPAIAMILIAATACADAPTVPLADNARVFPFPSLCRSVQGTGVMDLYDMNTPPITLAGDMTGMIIPGFPPELFPLGGEAFTAVFTNDQFITNEFGVFGTTTSTVLFAPVDPPNYRWNGEFRITWGPYSSGLIRQQGTLNLETGRGELTYSGRICP